jgi:protein involved in polysaccharide export with SLBB domain
MKAIIKFVLIVSLIVAGCSTESKFQAQDQSFDSSLYQEPSILEEYQFQIGDVFEVKIFGLPDYDQTIIVRPDGRISLPLVDNLTVAGMTPSELDQIITDNYKEKIKDPEVSVVLKEFTGQRIFIGGEVNEPGEKTLSSNMTLTRSIFQAGGFKRTAELKSVALIRRDSNNNPEIFLIDVDKIIYEGERDVPLKPSDMIFIPKSYIAKAGDFVDLYINQIIPQSFRFGLNFVYRVDDKNSRTGTGN